MLKSHKAAANSTITARGGDCALCGEAIEIAPSVIPAMVGIRPSRG